jgi:hypothetical protein
MNIGAANTAVFECYLDVHAFCYICKDTLPHLCIADASGLTSFDYAAISDFCAEV